MPASGQWQHYRNTIIIMSIFCSLKRQYADFLTAGFASFSRVEQVLLDKCQVVVFFSFAIDTSTQVYDQFCISMTGQKQFTFQLERITFCAAKLGSCFISKNASNQFVLQIDLQNKVCLSTLSIMKSSHHSRHVWLIVKVGKQTTTF